jgi:hypothetical protein
MATRYRIYAYSPSQNQRQQYMDLINDTMLASPAYAQQHATAFANRLNQQRFLQVFDWQASIEAYEHQDNYAAFTLPGRPL